MVFAQSRSSEYSDYTLEAKKDELTKILSSYYTVDVIEEETDDPTRTRTLYIFHLYLNQAEGLIYKFGYYDPPPEFVIFREHLPGQFVIDLETLPTSVMNEIITDAVRRIYESVDPEYYHTNGIHGKIRWRVSK